MNTLRRTIQFAWFILVEYVRSGRILIELLAGITFFYLFFRRQPTAMQPDYFFSTVGVFVLGLTFYTVSMILGLGDRPQGHLILVRRLGRGGYLLGLYFAALTIAWGIYALMSLAVLLYNPVVNLDERGWMLGTIPLLLNVALLDALLLLLSPMVLTSGWRLTALTLVAITFSGSLIGGQTMADMPRPLASALDALRTIFSTPLLPAFTGFALAIERDYSGFAFVIPLAQFSLTLSLLALAVYAFSRRELLFSGS